MIAPRSLGKRSEMSASRPSAAGVAPASTNRPNAAATAAASGEEQGRAVGVVDDQTGGHEHAAAEIPYRMIVVRRRLLESVAPVERPAPKIRPIDDRRAGDLDRREAAHQDLVGEVRVGLGELEDATG